MLLDVAVASPASQPEYNRGMFPLNYAKTLFIPIYSPATDRSNFQTDTFLVTAIFIDSGKCARRDADSRIMRDGTFVGANITLPNF